MSYLALARKWRPRDFSQVVGQEHVVNAFKHALDTNRVHHAFLLTGTRGIGKTTLARILAKSLNCETNGVSSTPCNTCSHCTAVDEGRFIDLIEVDAASRTKVDDTRDLLDNVQYAPTVGEYKIYLIDEVHMLSGHSFNALLKTLEEPPPHVKFVLATTDPQKLPVTVLSRCLQFYLKALSNEQISGQLKLILENEKVEFEQTALRLLARSAKGSMRDALSLLDQTIAFGGGSVEEAQVRAMLGLVDDQFVMQILASLADQDVNSLLGVCEQMAAKSVDFINAIEELTVKFHQISVLQFSPDIDVETIVDKEQLQAYVECFDKETLQLFYQIALLGKRDMYLAPDLRTGMEMALLRMIAFTPASAGMALSPEKKTDQVPPVSQATKVSLKQRITENREPAQVEQQRSKNLAVTAQTDANPGSSVQTQAGIKDSIDDKDTAQDNANVQNSTKTATLSANSWPEFAQQLSVTGFAREVVMNSILQGYDNDLVELGVDESCSHLVNDKRKALIETAFALVFGDQVKLKLTVAEFDEKTPQQLKQQINDENLQKAESSIMNDPNIKELIDTLDASIIPGSIKAT